MGATLSDNLVGTLAVIGGCGFLLLLGHKRGDPWSKTLRDAWAVIAELLADGAALVFGFAALALGIGLLVLLWWGLTVMPVAFAIIIGALIIGGAIVFVSAAR